MNELHKIIHILFNRHNQQQHDLFIVFSRFLSLDLSLALSLSHTHTTNSSERSDCILFFFSNKHVRTTMQEGEYAQNFFHVAEMFFQHMTAIHTSTIKIDTKKTHTSTSILFASCTKTPVCKKKKRGCKIFVLKKQICFTIMFWCCGIFDLKVRLIAYFLQHPQQQMEHPGPWKKIKQHEQQEQQWTTKTILSNNTEWKYKYESNPMCSNVPLLYSFLNCTINKTKQKNMCEKIKCVQTTGLLCFLLFSALIKKMKKKLPRKKIKNFHDVSHDMFVLVFVLFVRIFFPSSQKKKKTHTHTHNKKNEISFHGFIDIIIVVDDEYRWINNSREWKSNEC